MLQEHGYVVWCACLCPNFHQYQIILLGRLVTGAYGCTQLAQSCYMTVKSEIELTAS